MLFYTTSSALNQENEQLNRGELQSAGGRF
jgi:hypothetical protein